MKLGTSKRALIPASYLISTLIGHSISPHSEAGELELARPTIDGIIDETIWSEAEMVKPLVITRPRSYDKPSYATDIRYIKDEMGIYFLFICEQPISERTHTTTLRDITPSADYVEVILDFDDNAQRAFGFKVSHNGAFQDSVWRDGNQEESDWNGDWQYGVSSDENEWRVEIMVPWSIAPRGPSDKLGIYFARTVPRLNQQFSYPSINRSQQSFLTKFSSLEYSESSEDTLSISPYLSANFNNINKRDSYKNGVNVFWRWNQSNQINVSINPDFGQVESDELVVNLSAIETFFSEKRPFFRENFELFDLRGPEDLRLVHTPRIGSKPDAGTEESSGIDSAISFVRYGQQLDIGLMHAIEEDQSGNKGRTFTTTRIVKKIDETAIGALVNYSDRPALDRNALVLALDFQKNFTETMQLEGQLIHSRVNTGTTNRNDNGWWLTGEIEPTNRLSHTLTLFSYDEYLAVNDFGYVAKTDRKQFEQETTYRWPHLDRNGVRDLAVFFESELATNHRNEKLPWQIDIGIDSTFDDSSSLSTSVEYRSKGGDDLLTRGNNTIELPAEIVWETEFRSKIRDGFSFDASFSLARQAFDDDSIEITLSPGYQLSQNLNAEVVLAYRKSSRGLIWESQNLVGEFKQKEFSTQFGLSYVKANHEFRLRVDTVALHGEPRSSLRVLPDGAVIPTNESLKNITVGELALQLRYRFQFVSGAELYFVYSRGGEQDSDFYSTSYSRIVRKARNSITAESLFLKLRFKI